jgi:hypothetical protein
MTIEGTASIRAGVDDSQLLPFLTRIRRGDGTVPHFEVVLGTNNFSGNAAKSAGLAWRTSN